ncbi:cyclodeaminase [Roseibium sp. M-1]
MSHEIRLVTEAELRRAVHLDLEVIDRIEDAFAKLATGKVVMPPVLSMAIPDINAEVDVKTAYVPGLDGFAIKVSPGFFNNPSLGIASLNGLMVLFSARTGLVQAVFLDNGYLTDVRTAAAGAVAARHLAPSNVSTIGIIGTGVQAQLQLIAAAKVRPARRALIWGRDPEKARYLARDMTSLLGIEVVAADDRHQLVADSELVITTTPSKQALLTEDCLHAGLHITAMGSDQEDKNELAPAILARADILVCDRISQCEKLGELRSALEGGALKDASTVRELGDVIAGKAPGRSTNAEITVCDLTGTGVQDTAIATYALGKARQANAGTTIVS